MSELISILVPVYNEEGTIGQVLERLLTIALPARREIIVLNDGSRDNTRPVLDAFAAANPGVTMVHIPENRGKGHALRLGIARTTGSVVAIQDADLELDPAQLAGLIQPILRGEADAVYGSRFLAGSSRVTISRLGNLLLTWATNVLYGAALTDMETCYKVMRGDVARGLTLTGDRFEIEPEITAQLLRARVRLIELPVRFSPRSKAAGKKMRWRDGVTAL
ncbi:MAG: glycosyltransferase family 2 protein, partial [Alphaproteobacteria bacterium]